MAFADNVLGDDAAAVRQHALAQVAEAPAGAVRHDVLEARLRLKTRLRALHNAGRLARGGPLRRMRGRGGARPCNRAHAGRWSGDALSRVEGNTLRKITGNGSARPEPTWGSSWRRERGGRCNRGRSGRRRFARARLSKGHEILR